MPEWVKIIGLIVALLMGAYNVLRDHYENKNEPEPGSETSQIYAIPAPADLEAG